MFKKTLIALSFVIASASFASENNNNDKKPKEFKEGYNYANGPIYTGQEGRKYTQNNIDNQWGKNPEPKQEQTYEVRGYKIVSNSGSNQGSGDCILN